MTSVPTDSDTDADTASPSPPTRVAVALGSGGARGYAHIGVLAELQRRGYEVVAVSGSSMGALVGGLYAAGALEEFTDWARELTQGAVLRLLDPTFSAPGILRAGKILDKVRDIVGEVAIEDLPIPFTAVSTDLVTGRSVWLQHGPLDEAIRASIAIPGVIAPHILDGRLLADGGVLDPLPLAPLAAAHADLTIGVSLGGGGAEFTDDDADHSDADPSTGADWLNRIVRSTASLLDTDAVRSVLDRPTARALLDRFGASLPGDADTEDHGADGADASRDDDADAEAADEAPASEAPMVPKLGSFDVMNRSIDIAQAALARHLLAAYPPDLLIEVPRSSCRSLDFHRAGELIEVGRRYTARALDIRNGDPLGVTVIDP